MVTGEPVVSVIIPTYKRSEVVKRAVESVLKQTYKSIEIIVVDDNGKGDPHQLKTAEAVSVFGDNIKYIVHETNKKGSAARNTGWRNSSGKYIFFLDDDDEIDATRIEKQVACLEKSDESFGACYTGYHVLKADGTIQKSNTTVSGNVYLQALMRTLYMGSGSNIMLRRSAVDTVNGYDETFLRNQDIEFMARIFEKYKLAYVDEDLLTIHFEVRDFKQSFEFSNSIDEFYLEKFKDRINKLSKKDKKRVISVISVERVRKAVAYKKIGFAIKILLSNRVYPSVVIRYIFYIVYRYITNKSYGFYY